MLCREQGLNQSKISHLLELMRSEAFLKRIQDLPGYEPDNPGQITTFEELLAGDA